MGTLPDSRGVVSPRDRSLPGSRHTYSGASKNLPLRPSAGGCFCERWPAGGIVKHAEVIQVQPAKLLRLSFALAKVEGGTQVTLTYRVGALGPVGGDWTVGVTGRNLYTWTDYKGFDPEVGLVGTQAGTFGSGALTAVDAFTFPNLRSFSFNVSTRF